MDARQIATVHAAGRAVLGAALTVAPKAATAGWIGKDASRAPVTVVARALGVRDSVMGLGVLRTVSESRRCGARRNDVPAALLPESRRCGARRNDVPAALLPNAEAAKPWIAACLVADAVDLGATLAVRDQLPRKGAVAVSVVAAGSVLLGAWLLSALD